MQSVTVSVAEYIPSGYNLNGIIAFALGNFALPYIIDKTSVLTYVSTFDTSNKSFTITNQGNAWNDYPIRFVLIMSKNA